MEKSEKTAKKRCINDKIENYLAANDEINDVAILNKMTAFSGGRKLKEDEQRRVGYGHSGKALLQ